MRHCHKKQLTSTSISSHYLGIFQLPFPFPLKSSHNLESKKHSMKGIRSKKLSKIVTKWKRRGRFVVYSKDNYKFLVPLCFLNHPIFRVLLEMAEDEYGLTVHGPLRVPFEKEFMHFILCLLNRNGCEELEKAVLSFATCRN